MSIESAKCRDCVCHGKGIPVMCMLVCGNLSEVIVNCDQDQVASMVLQGVWPDVCWLCPYRERCQHDHKEPIRIGYPKVEGAQ